MAEMLFESFHISRLQKPSVFFEFSHKKILKFRRLAKIADGHISSLGYWCLICKNAIFSSKVC